MVNLLFISLFAFFVPIKTINQTAHCPFGFVNPKHDPNYCYKFVSTPATFDAAENYCQSLGGHLGMIQDNFANFFLADQAATDLPNSTDFWIGANQMQVQNFSIWVWKWYKAVVDYNDWSSGQPSSNYRCAAVNINSASWNSQDCSNSKAYLCQIPAVMNFCDCGWTYYNDSGFCYKLFNTNGISYSAAEQSCVDNNAHLVSIHSEGENDFIRDLSAQSGSFISICVWIGYSYPNRWSDGSRFDYSRWYSIPNLNDSYAVFIPDGITQYPLRAYPGYWTAYSFNTFKRYICKKQPTTYPYIN